MGLGDIISGIANFVTGGLGETIVDAVKDYFPPSMSDAEKATIEFRIKEVANRQEIELLKATNEAEQNFNQRIRDYEGTASDLKAMPIVGPVIIFLRGAFRPLFAYTVGFVDLKVFSNNWVITDPQIVSAFWLVNLLVLGFYFGERTMKNILPMLKEFLKKQ